jgi:hypothetical protein
MGGFRRAKTPFLPFIRSSDDIIIR